MAEDLFIFRLEVLKACDEAFPGNTLDIFNYNDFTVDINDIQFHDEIGKGAYGNVQSATYHGSIVAVKIQSIPPDNIQQCTNILIELSTMQSLPHDKLVRYYGAGNRMSSSGVAEILILMEHCEKGSLRSCLKSSYMPWKLRVRLALDAAWGLVFLHENNIIHRDIKTGNVLVDDQWRAKLCDMAFACHRSSPVKMMLTCGTEEFMAPEISLAYDCDLPADIFSFGIMLCEIMTGKEPGHDFLFRKAQSKFEVREDEIRNHLLPDCPEGLEALAYQCCDSEPKRRPNILQVIEELETVLMDLGGEDFIYTNDAGEELIYRPRRISQSNDASYTAQSEIVLKLSILETQMNDLRYENLRLASELSEMKTSSNVIVPTNDTTVVDPFLANDHHDDISCDVDDTSSVSSSTFSHILKNLAILDQRMQRIEAMQGNHNGSKSMYYPTTLDTNDLTQPIPADLWGQVGKVMNTLLGFNKRLGQLEDNHNNQHDSQSGNSSNMNSPRSNGSSDIGSSSDQERFASLSPNSWQSVAEFLAATVAAQKQLESSTSDDGLTSGVHHMSVDDASDSTKQLLTSLGSFLSTVGLYNNTNHPGGHQNVVDDVDRALRNADPSRTSSHVSPSKRGHSDMVANHHISDPKGTIRTPKISRIVGSSIQEGASKHPPTIRSRTSLNLTQSASNSPKSTGSYVKTISQSASSTPRSTSRSHNHSMDHKIPVKEKNHAFFGDGTERFHEPVDSRSNRSTTMNRALHHQSSATKPRSNSSSSNTGSSVSNATSHTASKTLRKSLADAEESVLSDIASAVAHSQHSETSSVSDTKKGIINLKDIIIEQASKDHHNHRSSTPSSLAPMSGAASHHKPRHQSLKDNISTKAS